MNQPPGLGGGPGGGSASSNASGPPPGLPPPGLPPPGLGVGGAGGRGGATSPLSNTTTAMSPPSSIPLAPAGLGGSLPSSNAAAAAASNGSAAMHGSNQQPQLHPQPSLGSPNAHPTTHGHHHAHPGAGGQPGSVSTIVKAQIVFLLSTLTEDSWERNVSEIRTLVSQNAPEMYHHFLRRLVVVAAPVIQSLQSQAAGMQVISSNVPGVNEVQPLGDKILTGQLSIPSNGAGVLAWRVLQSEGARAARDPSLGEFTFCVDIPSTHTHATRPVCSSSFRGNSVDSRGSFDTTFHSSQFVATRFNSALFIRIACTGFSSPDAFAHHARPRLRNGQGSFRNDHQRASKSSNSALRQQWWSRCRKRTRRNIFGRGR